MNKKITFIVPHFFMNGAEYVASLLAQGFYSRDIPLDILLYGLHKKMVAEHPDIKPFKIPEELSTHELPALNSFRNLWAMRNYLRREKPDIVISISNGSIFMTMVASKLAGYRPRIIATQHLGGFSPAIAPLVRDLSTIKNRLKHFKYRLLCKYIYRNVDCGIVVSRGVADEMIQELKLDPKKIEVIYNPVVTKNFHLQREQTPDHPWLIDKEIPTIVASGTLNPLKGFDRLIRAFADIRQQKPCRLIIFGRGVEKDNLIALATELGVQEDVSLPGFTNNLPACIDNASVFAIASSYESFSIVLVEALACGTPVVSTDCPFGPREILKDGKYGILVESESIPALTQGILRVLEGDGIQPPEESWRPYCLDHVINHYLDVFDKVAHE